jgi:hypothetical protein
VTSSITEDTPPPTSSPKFDHSPGDERERLLRNGGAGERQSDAESDRRRGTPAHGVSSLRAGRGSRNDDPASTGGYRTTMTL